MPEFTRVSGDALESCKSESITAMLIWMGLTPGIFFNEQDLGYQQH